MTRRRFLALAPLALTPLLAGAALRPSRLSAPIVRYGVHPDPRPGITGEDVLTADQLPGVETRVHEIFDMVREMPHIADGIGCYCGCAVRPGYRSLLTCYHQGGMAAGCDICQGEALLAHRRWKEGQELDRIRRAIDARYG